MGQRINGREYEKQCMEEDCGRAKNILYPKFFEL